MTCELNPPKVYKLNKRVNKQVVYLCGPHGVGKSTLIEDLKSFDMGRVKEQIAHMEGLTDNVSRQVWRNLCGNGLVRQALSYWHF
uniref:Uncharacterized protein n=1 Tax=viral metagenome TaxID=1070528 RepID=A0A6M3KY71_9ZZZZ